jgi:ribosome biogenesis GTPase A
VGKSTLINTLKGKRAAKTGDEAGVTKAEQLITNSPPCAAAWPNPCAC